MICSVTIVPAIQKHTNSIHLCLHCAEAPNDFVNVKTQLCVQRREVLLLEDKA